MGCEVLPGFAGWGQWWVWKMSMHRQSSQCVGVCWCVLVCVGVCWCVCVCVRVCSSRTDKARDNEGNRA